MGAAKISVSDQEPTMDCIILDWSHTGACIRLVEPDKCPDKLTLHTKDNRPTDCQVVWRQESNIGVQFLKPAVNDK